MFPLSKEVEANMNENEYLILKWTINVLFHSAKECNNRLIFSLKTDVFLPQKKHFQRVSKMNENKYSDQRNHRENFRSIYSEFFVEQF